MRTNIYILFIWLTCLVHAQGQTSGDFVEMSPDFCTNKKIMALGNGDTLLVTCDSIIVLSNTQFQYLKTVLAAYKKDTTQIARYEKLIASYEESIKTSKADYDKLFENAKKTEQISFGLIDRSLSTLDGTQKILNYTQTSLDHSIKSLEAAEKLLKQQRRKTLGQKLLVGIGGAGVGILTGLIILK
jgi:hypothetical protein